MRNRFTLRRALDASFTFLTTGRGVIIALSALFACAVAASITRRSESAAFCRFCGAEQSQISWAVRGTHLTLLRSHPVAATPISELLTRKNLVAAHKHEWQAPQLAPDPLDEFGPPVTRSLGFINAPRVVGFMRDLAEYGDANSVAQWRDLLLRPEYSYVIDSALRFLRAPATGFGQRDDFLAWWSSNGFSLYNRLREQTEAD